MDFNKLLSKLFGSKATRDMKLIQPWVEKIKAVSPAIEALTHDELRANTRELQHNIQSSADDLNQQISEIRAKIEETPIEERAQLFTQIDKLEKQVLERMDVALEEALPEAFA
ncbi:MAG: preprotein translocase subunit SecA, partial [Prevotellaceae bacterium]|nr:preprotein translocase subunit SecA [Prevotellaceae bacterium]